MEDISKNLHDIAKDMIEKQLLHDIVNIYNGQYVNYNDYVKQIQKYNELIKDIKLRCYLFVNRVILTHEHYDEIVNMRNEQEYYIFYVRKFSIMDGKNVVYKHLVKTRNRFEWVGKYYSTSIEQVERIDYYRITKEKYNELLNDKSYFVG